ncbi:hypothetical protein N9Q68_00985 [Polaribacter sp.]|nr:hypothetical protein [Polaribacter sp.]
MRKAITKIGIICSFLFVALQLISCDNSTKKAASTTVETTELIVATAMIVEEIIYRKPIVFITGVDKGKNKYYSKARTYFQEKEYEIIEDQYSIEEIILWLNNHKSDAAFGEIHIVNKSNPYKGLSLETVIRGEKVTVETLRRNITQGKLPKLNKVVAKNSKIIFHANGLGSNSELMKTIKDAFVTDTPTNIVASPYFTIFGGDFSEHYLAKPFYVFYPTANSPGKTDLSKEIARKYPEENEIEWYDALNNESERYIGEAYTTQFNVPVKYVLNFNNSDDEMPKLTSQEDVMKYLKQHNIIYADFSKIGIELVKFRWRWTIKNNQLTIKGKTTALCVLKPLTKPYGDLEHVEPDTSNLRMYATN